MTTIKKSNTKRLKALPDKTYKARPLFNAAYYLLKHTDLINAYGFNNYKEAAGHWMFYGRREGRNSSPAFDVKFYLDNHVDLQNAFGRENYLAAIDHWHNSGIPEGRQSCKEFSPKFYLDSHPDLQNAFGPTNYMAAINHWLDYGLREGRQGSPDFSIKDEVNKRPELKGVIEGCSNNTGYLLAWAFYYRNELDFHDNLMRHTRETLEDYLGVRRVLHTFEVKPPQHTDYLDCLKDISVAIAAGVAGYANKAALVVAIASIYDAARSCSNLFDRGEKAIENKKEREKRERSWTEKVDHHVEEHHLDKSKFGDYPTPGFNYA